MMKLDLCLLLILIKCTISDPSITSYPTIDLLENSPLNTIVIDLKPSLNKRKVVLLNLIGFESEMFSIIDETICTKREIDREEFVSKRYCLDNSYCKMELHLIIDDGLNYWIIPIHIVE
jgi:hypothetical protein